MNETTTKGHDRPSKSKAITLAGISAAWLAGMGALIFATLPSLAPSASHLAEQTKDTSTPLYRTASSPAPNVSTRPASATTQIAAPAASELTLRRESQSVDFIVKFQNDIPELEACGLTFRSDEGAARKMFADWAAHYDAMDGMGLKKASYSGEMILTWNTGIARPLSRAEVNAKLSEIKAMPSVKYADPDFTARAEGAR